LVHASNGEAAGEPLGRQERKTARLKPAKHHRDDLKGPDPEAKAVSEVLPKS
jgi:hypothetical protein